MNILIVEDDVDLAAAMADYLERQGACCDFAYHGQAGLRQASQYSYDVIVLDLLMPRINGYQLCQQLRQQGLSTPILMLTACNGDTDQLSGFTAGVDDYVSKPCPMPLLWARLQALHRRSNPVHDKLQIADLQIYLKQHRAIRQGQVLQLSPTAWRILCLLAKHSPKIVKRTEIEDAIWGRQEGNTGNLNVQLHTLRNTVDKPFDKKLIHTQVGVGLCLRSE
ncbi:MAG: response regulator transcription factor [Cellvibrionaceae bacterium]|nr:response regulator transcription factor [Cellvibrionaceae bacterium]MCV6626687.1 response regulator transcription factor [Cellvibrionaceae bacterium]